MRYNSCSMYRSSMRLWNGLNHRVMKFLLALLLSIVVILLAYQEPATVRLRQHMRQ